MTPSTMGKEMNIFKSITVLVSVSLLLAACKGESIADKRAALKDTEAELALRIEKITDPELREGASKVANIITWFQEIEIDQLEPPVSVVYEEDPFVWMQDYPESDVRLSNYRGGLIALTDVTHRLGSIDIKFPFDYPFDSKIVWEKVELADGTLVPVSGDFRVSPPDVSVSNGGSSLTVVPSEDGYTENTPLPSRLSGMLEIAVPEDVVHLSLTKKDIGNAHKIGDYAVKLTEINGHGISLEVTRQDGGIIVEDPIQLLVETRDNTGQFLARSGGSSGPSDDFFEMFSEQLLTLLTQIEQEEVDVESIEAEMERRSDSLKDKFGGLYVQKEFFRGTVETVEVVFAAAAMEQKIPLDLTIYHDSALSFDDPLDIIDIPVQSVAYAHELAYLTASDRTIELAPQKVATAIKIEPATRWGDEVHVEFAYPEKTVSNLFVGAFDRYEFDSAEVAFFDADGQEISGPPPHNFTVNRLEYMPSAFPVQPTRMTGKFEVNLMPELQFKRYAVDALPENIRVSDNKLIKTGSYQGRMYAMDGDGRFLRKFYSQQFPSSKGPSTNVDYYYGEPSAVLIVNPGPIERIEYRFDADISLSQSE